MPDMASVPRPDGSFSAGTMQQSTMQQELVPSFSANRAGVLALRNRYRSANGISRSSYQQIEPMNAFYEQLANGGNRSTGQNGNSGSP